MFKEYLLLLVLGHIIGDFYIQTESMAYKKHKDIKNLLLHGLVYWLSMVFVSAPVISLPVFLFATMASALHLLIDYLKYLFVGNKREKGDFKGRIEQYVFFADQVLHVFGLVLLAYLFISLKHTFKINHITHSLLSVTGIRARNLLTWQVVLLTAHKPVNLIISKLLMGYKPSVKGKTRGINKKAGRYIGTLERIIILLFITLNQYSAIGLVLTAKSIARYDKITKDESFAEYYLLGTLLSTLSAIALSFIF